MARTNWLLNRNGRYYLQARVPQDLVGIIGKTFIKKSLHTSDRREAEERLVAEAVEVKQQFAEARRKLEAKVERITPALTDHESKRLAYLWFRQAERQSIEQAFREPELNHIALEDAYEELGMLLGDEEEFAPYVQDVADSVLIGAGFPIREASQLSGGPSIRPRINRPAPDIDKGSAEYQKLCERIRRGMIENVRRQQRRYQGQPTVTIDPAFAPEAIERAATGPAISQILEMRLAESKPSPAMEKEWRRSARWFIELHGDLAIDEITKTHVREFKDALLRKPINLPHKVRKLPLPKILEVTKGTNQPRLSAEGVKKPLKVFKALLSWAVSNGYIETNPAIGITVSQMKKIADDRLAFGSDDLRKLFEASVQFRRTEPHKFWLPLLAAYTGARIGELVQLRLGDIRVKDGLTYISINAENGKRLKTKSSVRDVPIHPVLIECGFLDYVEERRKARDGNLFPEMMQKTKEQTTQKFAKFFRRYCDSLGITDKRKVFHSFRHTFKEGCRAAHVPEEVHDALTGHSNGSVGRGYGSVPLATKAEAVRKIDYKIDLSHLHLSTSNHNTLKLLG